MKKLCSVIIIGFFVGLGPGVEAQDRSWIEGDPGVFMEQAKLFLEQAGQDDFPTIEAAFCQRGWSAPYAKALNRIYGDESIEYAIRMVKAADQAPWTAQFVFSEWQTFQGHEERESEKLLLQDRLWQQMAEGGLNELHQMSLYGTAEYMLLKEALSGQKRDLLFEMAANTEFPPRAVVRGPLHRAFHFVPNA